MSNKKLGLFCPSCLQRRPDVTWEQLLKAGLDPVAHNGHYYMHGVRRHGIVRNGIFRLRATIHRQPGNAARGVMGRTWATCADPWHERVAKLFTSYGDPIDQRSEPREPTERPPLDDLRARGKAKALRHKERQAKR